MKYPPGLGYAHEKFSHAVYLLAIGSGDVRSRLRNAFIHFIPVKEKDIPDELLEDFRWIIRELTKRKPVAKEGTMTATLERMQNRTGMKIAIKIYDLASRLEGYYDQQMNEEG
jgi:hypothetical protein